MNVLRPAKLIEQSPGGGVFRRETKIGFKRLNRLGHTAELRPRLRKLEVERGLGGLRLDGALTRSHGVVGFASNDFFRD